MKRPREAPPARELLARLELDPARLSHVLSIGRPKATVDGQYLHWDQLRHRKPPRDLTHEEWWGRIRLARGTLSKSLPLRDVSGKRFTLATPDLLQRALHKADRDLSGRVPIPSQLTTEGIRDRYQMSALIEEAITSSQLEGAATTRRVAKEMLRSGREPRSPDERMIHNNFLAMEAVREAGTRPMTPDLVRSIHSIVTDQTLDDPTACGRLRTAAESGDAWGVYSPDGELLHTPPPADQLQQRLEDFCAFANDDSDANFIHPIARSILLHFWIGYDHPFVDGNGRTARALFYWSMIRHGYWLAEFLSVSNILHKAPVRYSMSYLYSETDDNDATYFVLYQMEVLRKAIDALLAYVTRKSGDIRKAQDLIRQSPLNHRQVALLSHALCNQGATYTATQHGNSHRVTRQTARSDLKELATLGLLQDSLHGRTLTFSVPGDLEKRLRELGSRQPDTPGPRGPGRPPRITRQPDLFDDP